MDFSSSCSEIINNTTLQFCRSQINILSITAQEFLINAAASLKYFFRHSNLIFKLYFCSNCSSVKYHVILKLPCTVLNFNHHLTQDNFNILVNNINSILFAFCDDNALLTRSS